MKKALTHWNKLSTGAKDWVISLALSLVITLGLFGSGAIAEDADIQNLKLDAEVSVDGTTYSGILYASVGRQGESFPCAGKALLQAEDGRELTLHIASLAKYGKGRYSLAYSASATGNGSAEVAEFAGNATVFPTDDGYRIVQVVTSGESRSSGTGMNIVGIGIGSSQSTSVSKRTTKIRLYDVVVSDGKGAITRSDFTLPDLPIPERG